jgi:hypothetical protein
MSTYTSEPGTRLAGRYRLEDQVDAGGGWALWKAIDEILARAVTVLMFAENFPRVREAVTAARAASRLNDSRLSQVFDVDDSGERAYIVMEWVAGESLADMLSDGPLDPPWAAALVAEAAQAISVAHAAGLAHLRLVPGSLRWTSGGGAKITGLGMDAAIAGAGTDEDGAEDPAVVDTRHLAWLMYAAVTGYWPGPQDTGLPPAPTIDGSVCTPRQVSAGVPASVDSIISQGMFGRQARNGQTISTPLEFADALAEVAAPAVPTPVPFDEVEQTTWNAGGGQAARYNSSPADPPPWSVPGAGAPRAVHGGHGGRPGRGGRPRSSGAAKALVSALVVIVLVAVGAVVYAFSHSSTGEAAAVIDGSPTTDWHSQFYIGNPVFGGLKKGTGLLLDMGTQVKLSQVDVQFGSTCCTSIHIDLGNSDSPASESGFSTVASSTKAVATTKFSVSSSAKGRYVLLWFTSLPPLQGNSNEYEAQVYNVVVRGSS